MSESREIAVRFSTIIPMTGQSTSVTLEPSLLNEWALDGCEAGYLLTEVDNHHKYHGHRLYWSYAMNPQSVSKAKLKPHLLEYLCEVQTSGRELIITDRGRPVLKTVPYAEKPSRLIKKLRGSVTKYRDPRGRLHLTMDPRDWIAQAEVLRFMNFVPVDNQITTKSVQLPGTLQQNHYCNGADPRRTRSDEGRKARSLSPSEDYLVSFQLHGSSPSSEAEKRLPTPFVRAAQLAVSNAEF